MSQASRSREDLNIFDSDPVEEDTGAHEPTQELEKFFDTFRRLKSVDPLQWWHMAVSEFPNVARLARDLLSIPGMDQPSCYLTPSL